MPGITVAKERRNSKINTLSLNRLTTTCLSGDVLLHYHGTNLSSVYPANLILHLNPIPRKEPKSWKMKKRTKTRMKKKKEKQALHKITCKLLCLWICILQMKEERTPLAIYDVSLWAVSLRWWRCMNSQYLINFNQFSFIYCYHDKSNYHIS